MLRTRPGIPRSRRHAWARSGRVSRVAMKQLFLASAGMALLGLGLAARDGQTPAARTPAPTAAPHAASAPAPQSAKPAKPASAARPVAPTMVAAEQTKLVTTYCATCHSERGKAGGISLASFDVMRAHENPAVI